MHTLRRHGPDIAYDISGSRAGRGSMLLLTHGFCATSRMFDPNVAALAVDNLVITWDLPGHGASGAPDDPSLYSVALVLAQMIALLDHMDVPRATLVGHSLGGFLSLEFAMAHPDRVEALILVDTGPGFRRDEGRDDWNAMAERYAKSLTERGLDGIPVGPELSPGGHRSAAGLAHFARNVLTQRDASVLNGLPSIGVPTLVIVGSEDAAFLSGSEYMAAKIPMARLVVIPGAGHAPNIDQPDVFDRCVQEFVAANRAGRA
jgi:pimeloyl-ACP methyl ester carboxylesterase